MRVGAWNVVADLSAALGARLQNADAGVPKVTSPAINPPHYFEMQFTADAGVPYRLWIRSKALNDFWANDSVWVQFSDSVNSSNTPVFRIGTTSGTEINLEDCSGCGLANWGWQDNGWGVGVLGPQIFFQTTGTHTIRIQTREDGIGIDQIVLSALTYLHNSPGALKNDTTILPESGGPPPPQQQPPTVTSVSPNSGTTAGGTSVTIAGTNFSPGATITFGGSAATNVNVVNGTTINAATPAHAAGAVNVIVMNTNGLSGSLTSGYTYIAPSEATILDDNFNDNSIDPNKWTTNNLFSGFTDATLPTLETNQRLQVGPFVQGQSGSHYNGIRSRLGFNFAGAYSYVELVQGPAVSTKADAMFTIGRDANNYYRMYVEEGVFICQSRIGGTKQNLFTAAYSSSSHRYWRIRHDQATGNVVFETAPDNGGLPGAWTIRFNAPWNNGAVPLSSVLFELKGGTWQPETTAPGVVVFDNFKAARP